MSQTLKQLLRDFREGTISEDEILQRIVREPFEEHMLGKFDHHRQVRTGIPEAILAEGKDPQAVAAIFEDYLARNEQLIATRVTPEILDGVADLLPELHYYKSARILSTQTPVVDTKRKKILVLSAGALDRPVAEEALFTAQLLENPVEAVFDVGVAGLSRFASELSRLENCGIVIVVAGMDGVLPSLVGGLARQPVIAVPTSVGYGASFNGLAPLLTMLNSCSPGTAVMNIDNGFGAGVLATKINLLASK